jgi:hypothetical protein
MLGMSKQWDFTFPMPINIGMNTFGLDLVPIVPTDGTKVNISYFDYSYVEGNVDIQVANYLDFQKYICNYLENYKIDYQLSKKGLSWVVGDNKYLYKEYSSYSAIIRINDVENYYRLSISEKCDDLSKHLQLLTVEDERLFKLGDLLN